MTLAMIAILLAAFLTSPALAAPGDPRFVQGTLEWPSTLTREPVIIVRGDDGHAYYCDVTDAVRHRAEGLRVGGRVSVLGLEAARSHELTSIVIGTGDAASLARALSQNLVRPPAPAPAPPPPVAATPPPPPAAVQPPAPEKPATPPPAAAPDPAAAPLVIVGSGIGPTAPATPAAPSTAAAPAAAAATPAHSAPEAAPPAVAAASPSSPATTAAASAPAAPATPAPAAATPSTPVAAAPTAATASVAAPTTVMATTTPRRAILPGTAANGGRGQWSRLDGTVESVAGSTLTLKMDDGALAYVDISQLSPNVAQVLRQGTVVTVYGYPIEQRFEAAGYIQTNSGSTEPQPRVARPKR
jgi:hypothetical protein